MADGVELRPFAATDSAARGLGAGVELTSAAFATFLRLYRSIP
jgi:hypothetical protein